MSNINRWRQMIIPKRDTFEWVLGNGGSWDRTEPNPISDEHLAELAMYSFYQGQPWNCRSMPLSESDREYMFLLHYSMYGMVARIRANEKRIAELELALAEAKQSKPVTEFHTLHTPYGSCRVKLVSENSSHYVVSVCPKDTSDIAERLINNYAPCVEPGSICVAKGYPEVYLVPCSEETDND